MIVCVCVCEIWIQKINEKAVFVCTLACVIAGLV